MYLSYFNILTVNDATNVFFRDLGIMLHSNTAQALAVKDVLENQYHEREPFTYIKNVYLATTRGHAARGHAPLLYSLELSQKPNRSEISEITRAFKRKEMQMPVVLLFKYEHFISLALPEIFLYKQTWRQGEKINKVIIVRDINIANTHAGHLRIIEDLMKHHAKNFNELHEKWLEVFDVNNLNKKFYAELSNWYFWAIKNVSFPDDIEKDDEVRHSTNLIRLITRVIFIWFIKEMELVPENLFNKDELEKILKDFDPNGENKKGNYYHAILQNLFFGALNQRTNERKFLKDEDLSANMNEKGVKNLYRYANMFQNNNEDEICKLFDNIPFLNGGLFDCLDIENEGGRVEYVDGFSRNKNKQTIIPDFLFFGNERDVDLNHFYDTRGKIYKSKGLINILNSYKFTITENTSQEEDVALDPELIGKVFENLLASYNPETKITARKQTGSFYTPREIVDYMVQESLSAYLQTITDLDLQISDEEGIVMADGTALTDEVKTQVIHSFNSIKILDPACGSGAFPMGILHRMVKILQKIDPENKEWRKLQEDKVMEKTKDAYKIENQQERIFRLKEISDIFENNNSDYGRKLFLIENCIFGVDIQPVAIHISKLRLFISLIIDQKTDQKKANFGIHPLPNLETKFVAANTLIGVEWMFDRKEGFDVVIGNPPYIDSETMTNIGMEYLRNYIVKNYKYVSGNWDIYMAFFEKGLSLSNAILCYITPDKWLSKPFGLKFRENCMMPRMKKILHVGSNIFDSVRIDGIVSLFVAKSNTLQILKFDKNQKINEINRVEKNEIISPFIIDFLFSENSKLIKKIEKSVSKKIADFAFCEGACATSDAYKLKQFVENKSTFAKEEYYILINTGTIEKFCHRWGRKEMTYLNDKILYPVVHREKFVENFGKTYISKVNQPKLILKGLNLLDAFIDLDGCILPAKTTLVICTRDFDLLKVLCGIINSKLAIFYIKIKYSSSSYCGGITFTKDMMDHFPLPEKDQHQPLIALVDQILSAKQENPAANTLALEREMDRLVYALYGLSEEEIEIIERK